MQIKRSILKEVNCSLIKLYVQIPVKFSYVFLFRKQPFQVNLAN